MAPIVANAIGGSIISFIPTRFKISTKQYSTIDSWPDKTVSTVTAFKPSVQIQKRHLYNSLCYSAPSLTILLSLVIIILPLSTVSGKCLNILIQHIDLSFNSDLRTLEPDLEKALSKYDLITLIRNPLKSHLT